MIAYFLPMLPGAHKVYSTPEQSFWCCVGTGFENHAKYGEAIYYHDHDALYISLFIASELSWKDKGVKIRQETASRKRKLLCLRLALNLPPICHFISVILLGQHRELP